MSDDRLAPNDQVVPVLERDPEPRRRHHPFFYIGATFLNAVVFGAVGPVVGGLISFMLAAAETSILAALVAPLVYLSLFFGTIPASYFIAGFAPALTGAIVAIATIWMSYTRYLYLFAAVTGGFTSSILISRADFFTRGDNPPSPHFMLFVSGSLAAVICTRVARPFRLGVPAGPDLVASLPAEKK